MKISGIDHLHIFENDRDAAVNFFSDLLCSRWIGLDRSWLKIIVAFSDNGIEVIQPIGKDSMGIAAYLEKHGPGIGSVGVLVPEIEKAITEIESKGVELAGKGSYATKPEVDIKAAVFKPDKAHGVPLEIVEYGMMTPMAITGLNLVQEMPWMQPPKEGKKETSIMGDRIDHLNLFQFNLEESVKFFGDLLGLRWIGPIEHPELKIRMAFSDAGINIIQPTGQDSLGISDYMKKHGEGTGSLGFKVTDIEAAISEFESKDVKLIGKGMYASNPNTDLKVAVFDPESAFGVMFELVEYQNTTPVALANLDWVKRLPWME